MKRNSKGALVRNNKTLTAIVAVALALLIAGSVVLGVGFGVYGNDTSKWFKKDTTPPVVQEDPTPTPDPTPANPLDAIKPVDKLTSDMWVTGWLVDPEKEPDFAKLEKAGASKDVGMNPIDIDLTDYSSASTLARLCTINYNESNGQLGFDKPSNSSNIFIYIQKNSYYHAQAGSYGWCAMGYPNSNFIKEKYVYQLPCAVRYDCTYYDLFKDFMIPVVDANHKCAEPVTFEANKPIIGFKFKDYNFKGLDLNLEGLKNEDMLLEGTVVSNPLGIEVPADMKFGFAYVEEDDEKGIIFTLLDFGMVVREEYSTWDMGGLSKVQMLPYGIVLKFADTSAYTEHNLWKILEPIYAEEVTNQAEAEVLGYKVDMDKVSYVDIERGIETDHGYFRVNEQTGTYQDVAIKVTIIDVPSEFDDYNTFCYIDNIEAVQQLMTDSNYEGTINEFLTANFSIHFSGETAVVGEKYGEVTCAFIPDSYMSGTNYMNIAITAFIDWLNANGFEDAVTPVYAQYK